MCQLSMNKVLKTILLVTILIVPFVIGMPSRTKLTRVTRQSSQESDEYDEIEDFLIIATPLVCGGNQRRGSNGRCRPASRFIRSTSDLISINMKHLMRSFKT